MGFENVDINRCSICGINQAEIIRASNYINSGANNDFNHTSNPYYNTAWNIMNNYMNGKYFNYIYTRKQYTDIDLDLDDDAGYHQQCKQ